MRWERARSGDASPESRTERLLSPQAVEEERSGKVAGQQEEEEEEEEELEGARSGHAPTRTRILEASKAHVKAPPAHAEVEAEDGCGIGLLLEATRCDAAGV
jgi:hypothetical protein